MKAGEGRRVAVDGQQERDLCGDGTVLIFTVVVVTQTRDKTV